MAFKQNISVDRKLNEINHDYQRMRKRAVKRISKRLGTPIPEKKDHLGADAWVHIKRINPIEAGVWVVVGLLIGFWIH